MTSTVPSRLHVLSGPLMYIQRVLRMCLRQNCFTRPRIILAICTCRNRDRCHIKRGNGMCVAQQTDTQKYFLFLLGLQLDCFSRPPLQ